MALVPKEIDDRITALEESNVLLEERLALLEEALAPAHNKDGETIHDLFPSEPE